MNCFVCGEDLGSTSLDADLPAGGTVFRAYGNYGSTLWDPTGVTNQYLRIVVCDTCLREGVVRGLVDHLKEVRRSTAEWATTTWDGEPE